MCFWEAEHHANDEDAVEQPDGSYLYKGPNGRMETWSQRQSRLRHNEKMQFNRSFRILTHIFLEACLYIYIF